MNRRNYWFITGGAIAFVAVILVALFVPSPMNFQKVGYKPTNKKNVEYVNPTSLTTNADALAYMQTYKDQTNDFVLYFDGADVYNEDLKTYFNFFLEHGYYYTIIEYRPLVDEEFRNQFPDLPLDYTFSTEDWLSELNAYETNLNTSLDLYGEEGKLKISKDAFNRLRVHSMVVTTSNEAMYDFLYNNSFIRFSFYDEGNKPNNEFHIE